MNDYLIAYHDEDTERIESQVALTEVLDKVAALPRPTWAELVSADDKQVLNVALGREFSSLIFYDMTGDGAKYYSAGTVDGPKDADFDYGGVPTSMGTGSAITVEQARAAAAEFLTMGQRPEVVAWELAAG